MCVLYIKIFEIVGKFMLYKIPACIGIKKNA